MMKDKKNIQDTLLLPKTPFPMRAGLAMAEPKWLAWWQDIGLYQKQRKMRQAAEKFILHDGPPYANGNIHIGHALNKILKDIVSRSQNMLGKDSIFVPGWDCHGLPIEWKVEEDLRSSGENKNNIAVNSFRKLCRDYANKWLKVQCEEFKRLGVMGDWDNYYSTMDFLSESIIADEIGKVAMSGKLYQAYKPVMWSIPEQTALAEAEVEYKHISSSSILVGFAIDKSDIADEVVIWTTTPWTIPANRAVGFHKNIAYGVYSIVDFNGKARRVILAEKRCLWAMKMGQWQSCKKQRDISPDEFSGLAIRHPLIENITDDYPPLTQRRYFYHADFVSDDAGTGFVHIAPNHGVDDYHAHLAYDKDDKIHISVVPHGEYGDHITRILPELKGVKVYDDKGKDGGANGAVIKKLAQMAKLLGKENYQHPYPHSWRSKSPIIFLATSQWFMAMDGDDSLRQKSLKVLHDVISYPANGKNALTDMIATRPDWCVSRQRSWGVPLPFFIDKNNSKPLFDKKLFQHVKSIFAKQGADVWFDEDNYPNEFWLKDILPAADIKNYTKIKDVVDVWFDSGSTHAFVLEQRKDLQSPADLYLEGIDQHRGWFHSSLLQSVATRGRAPYRALLTHGFTLDEKGNKMSKSLGNVIAPADVIKEHGADILRLWVVASNYTENHNIGKNILMQNSESYRRIRNTFRWLLGVLATDPDVPDHFEKQQLPLLEQYILRRLADLSHSIINYTNDFEFNKIFLSLYRFCDQDLSAFYFDVRKDRLYCDDKNSIARKQTMFVLNYVFDFLCKWFAPILCFTAEEAWHAHPRYKDRGLESVHLEKFPNAPASWQAGEEDKWVEKIIDIRKNVLQVLEMARKDKKIGSALESHITLSLPETLYQATSQWDKNFFDWADIFIVSSVILKKSDDIHIAWQMAEGDKCGRCWKILPEVTSNLCKRCQQIVGV